MELGPTYDLFCVHDLFTIHDVFLCCFSASVLFTNYDLIWFQIHEMLRIEKGGDEQVGDELAAYKDMIRECQI